MANLTEARMAALYQCLELPRFPQQATVWDDGSVARVHDVTSSTWAVPTLINNHLTTYIYTDVNIQTALEGLLDSWVLLGTDVTALSAGAIGNVSGIDYATQGEREEIRRQVLVYVPYYRYHEQMQRGGGCIPIIR